MATSYKQTDASGITSKSCRLLNHHRSYYPNTKMYKTNPFPRRLGGRLKPCFGRTCVTVNITPKATLRVPPDIGQPRASAAQKKRKYAKRTHFHTEYGYRGAFELRKRIFFKVPS